MVCHPAPGPPSTSWSRCPTWYGSLLAWLVAKQSSCLSCLRQELFSVCLGHLTSCALHSRGYFFCPQHPIQNRKNTLEDSRKIAQDLHFKSLASRRKYEVTTRVRAKGNILHTFKEALFFPVAQFPPGFLALGIRESHLPQPVG